MVGDRMVGLGKTWRTPAKVLLLSTIVLVAEARASTEPIERTGEILLTPSESWAEPGFRVQLKVGTERLSPLDDEPSGGGLSLTAEPGVRLSRYWSLSAALRYTVLNGSSTGLRWSTTADVSFHPVGGLFLSVGAGYAGLMMQSNEWFGSFASCTGSGAAVLGRIGYLIPLGELFATGPVIQTDAQWVRCGQSDVESIPAIPEPGFEEVPFPSPSRTPASRTWRHRSLHFSWSLAWR